MLGLGLGLKYITNLIGGGVPSFIDTFGQPAIGLSLRDLLGTDPNVLRVRRDSDDAELDFKASEVSDGTLLNWVNGANNEVMVNPDITSATGWTLGGNTTYNASTEAFDLAGASGLTVRQTKSIEGIAYDYEIEISNYTSGTFRIYAGGNQSDVISGNGIFTGSVIGGSANDIFGINPSVANYSVNSFSVTQKTANGLVRTWYGQGNGVNAEQATASFQPSIVINGVLNIDNGLPAIQSDGTQYLQTTLVTLTGGFCVMAIHNGTGWLAGQSIGGFDGARISGSQLFYIDGAVYQNVNNRNNIQTLSTFNRTQDNQLRIYYNETEGVSSPFAGASGNWSTKSILSYDGGILIFTGKIQSFLMYNEDKLSELPDIQSDIVTYYSIY